MIALRWSWGGGGRLLMSKAPPYCMAGRRHRTDPSRRLCINRAAHNIATALGPKPYLSPDHMPGAGVCETRGGATVAGTGAVMRLQVDV